MYYDGNWIRLRNRVVTARKDHECCECKKTIKKGQRYQRFDGFWDSWEKDIQSGYESYKTCLECELNWREILELLGEESSHVFSQLEETIKDAFNNGLLNRKSPLVQKWLKTFLKERDVRIAEINSDIERLMAVDHEDNNPETQRIRRNRIADLEDERDSLSQKSK